MKKRENKQRKDGEKQVDRIGYQSQGRKERNGEEKDKRGYDRSL